MITFQEWLQFHENMTQPLAVGSEVMIVSNGSSVGYGVIEREKRLQWIVKMPNGRTVPFAKSDLKMLSADYYPSASRMSIAPAKPIG